MTDRERRAVLKRNVAERDLTTARAKLRQALVDGLNTSATRREIESLVARVEQAEAELAEMVASADVAKAARLSTMAATITAEATTKIKSNLDRLRPPAISKTPTEEPKL